MHITEAASKDAAVSTLAPPGRYQFSLRHLLIAVSVTAVILAACPKTVHPDMPIALFCYLVLAAHLGIAYWAARREGRHFVSGPPSAEVNGRYNIFLVLLGIGAVPAAILAAITIVTAKPDPYTGYSVFSFLDNWFGPMVFGELVALPASLASLWLPLKRNRPCHHVWLATANVVANLIACVVLWFALIMLTAASC